MGLKKEADKLFSIDPRNGEVIDEIKTTRPEQIPATVTKAQEMFEGWSAFGLHARLKLVKQAYRTFFEKRHEIVQLISQETGKPLVESYSNEILPVLDCFKYYIKHARRILKTRKVTANNPLFKLRRGLVFYEPLGVIVVISPWNFPFLLAMQHLIPAILAGNAVIHKPSEYTSLVGLKIRDLFSQAGLPENVLQIVCGLADVGAALVQAPVAKIIFTGSTQVGEKIYQAAAKNLVPVSMELGGSDPMVVLEDANLERAANAAVWGAFSNAGQACVSVERLFVHESIQEEFTKLLLQKTQKLQLTNGTGNNPDVSCLANEPQLQKMSALLADGVSKGAVVKLGGKTRGEVGRLYFEPTVLSHVDPSMNILQKEIFGPVVCITPFRSDEEVVDLANDSDFGLSGSVWTEDRKRGLRLAKRIQSGSVLINDLYISIAQMEAPYSGYKKSGLGVSHGPWGLMEVVKPKYINSDRKWVMKLLSMLFSPFGNNDIWWFKYSDRLLAQLDTLGQFLHSGSFLKKIQLIPGVIKALLRKDYL